jgi:hypothetical protein
MVPKIIKKKINRILILLKLSVEESITMDKYIKHRRLRRERKIELKFYFSIRRMQPA